jgi:hypothetical protein
VHEQCELSAERCMHVKILHQRRELPGSHGRDLRARWGRLRVGRELSDNAGALQQPEDLSGRRDDMSEQQRLPRQRQLQLQSV